MGRPKRHISEDGVLVCKFDPDNWHAAHYTEFYGYDREPLDYWYDPVEDIWIGKMSAWCRSCMNKYQKTRYRPQPTDPKELEVIKEYQHSQAVQEIADRAGQMGPPPEKVKRHWEWEDEEPVFPERPFK